MDAFEAMRRSQRRGAGAGSGDGGAAAPAGDGGGDGGDDGGGRILVMRMEIPIRWGDMDAVGHVNNTVYFRYMEQIRISWFDALGFAPDPAGAGPLIVNAHCTFQRELVYPGTVLASQYVSDVGRSSWQTWITLSRTDDPQTVYAHGGAKCVWVDFPNRRSAPLPDAAREAIQRPFDASAAAATR